MKVVNTSKKLFLIIVCAFLFRFLLAFSAWHIDVNNHVDWGTRFFEYGAAGFYSPEANVWNFTWPNQPPGSIYIYAGIYKLFGFLFSIVWWLNIKIPIFPSGIVTFFETNLFPALLKLPAILADMGIAILIYKFVELILGSSKKTKKVALFGATLWLINPVIWYNSSLWGQTDSVVNFLVLLGFYLLFRKKLIWAALAVALSIYTKASLLIFVPIFAILAIRQKYRPKQYLFSVVVPLLVIGALTLPFSAGEPFSWLVTLYKDKVFTEQLQVITANAFNLWGALTGLHEKSHELLFGPLSFKMWGTLLYGISYLYAIYLVWKKQDAKSVLWVLSIVAFSSFMLLTNMHERYLFPLFAPFTVLAALERGLLPLYAWISGVNLINLYHLWWVPKFEPLVNLLITGNRLVPRLLSAVNTALFGVFASRFLRHFKATKL